MLGHYLASRLSGYLPGVLTATQGGSSVTSLDLFGPSVDPRITFTRSTTKTYFGADGLMHTAAINEWPLEYDPITHEALGRSVWESRTNLLLRSQEFDNAGAWGAASSTRTPNVIAAPDGTLTADLITSTGAGQVTQTATATSTSHVFSIFIKVGNAALATTQIILRNTTTATNLCIATLTWATMTVTGVGASIYPVGDGWYRVVTTASAGITVGDSLTCYAGTFSGAGLTYYVWGAQLESGLIPSPYIATTSATVTRAADAPVLNSLASLGLNAAGYTVLVDAYTSYIAAPAVQEAYLSLNNNTGNNRVMLRRETTAQQLVLVNEGGVTQAGLSIAGPGAGTRVKVAARIAPNNFGETVNGGAVSTDVSGTLPTVTRGDIGNHLSGTYCNSPIRSIRIYPQPFADAELQALAA